MPAEYTIKAIKRIEQGVLKQFLYEAIFNQLLIT